MQKRRTTEMSKALVLIAALGAGLPVAVSARTVQGVDFDTVPWATFCPSIKSGELHTGAGDCPVVHPASTEHARWDNLGTGVKERKPNCKRLEKQYRQLTTPKVIGGKKSWAACTVAFSRILNMRAMQPERFAEPFEQWRDRYFGPGLTGGKR
jgi:hypothetical protein